VLRRGQAFFKSKQHTARLAMQHSALRCARVSAPLTGRDRSSSTSRPSPGHQPGSFGNSSSAGDSESEREEIKAILEINLEIVAEAEHDGWIEFKRRLCWRPVEHKSLWCDEKRLHHLVVLYQQLPGEDRDKDCYTVRCYAEIVAKREYSGVAGPPTNSTWSRV
jgi:hypothetical protein